MGKIAVLIAGLVMILAHTVSNISTDSFGADQSVLSIVGFFYIYFRVSSSFGGATITSTDSQSFETSWFDDNDFYENLFGNAIFAALIIVLIVAAIGLAFMNDDTKISGLLLIASAVLLLVLRFQQLNDQDLSFYKNENGLTYLEIPLGFLAGLIGGVMSIRS